MSLASKNLIQTSSLNEKKINERIANTQRGRSGAETAQNRYSDNADERSEKKLSTFFSHNAYYI